VSPHAFSDPASDGLGRYLVNIDRVVVFLADGWLADARIEDVRRSYGRLQYRLWQPAQDGEAATRIGWIDADRVRGWKT
jgi:hypothetical protein